jgi:4-azaleucine resistance transporter AzlC
MPRNSRRDEFMAGVRGELPLLLGVAPFGFAYGAYAVNSGLSTGMAQAMSAIVFGGASQFVGVRQIAGDVPGIVVVLTALLVNARHALYSASVAPYVDHLSARWRWLLAYLLTDEGYAAAIARLRDGASPHRHWFLFGTCAALWASWQVTTAMGVFVGTAVPASWSLEFALPLTFIALIVPVLRDRASIAAAVVAGAVATIGFRWEYGINILVPVLLGLGAALVVARAWRDENGPTEELA